MFGHDNQDNNHDENGTNGHLTIPDPVQDEQDKGTPSTAPSTSSTQDNDNAAGGFLPSANEPGANVAPADELLDIKQQALQALSPLVGHLDQTPEEKFRTTMMMIQASDDHSLIKIAYESAKGIENEKERAQALLDIVNEINYFTQHQQAA